jgi:hypothetical protein
LGSGDRDGLGPHFARPDIAAALLLWRTFKHRPLADPAQPGQLLLQ